MTDDILSSLQNVFPLQAGCSHPELFNWVENLELERELQKEKLPQRCTGSAPLLNIDVSYGEETSYIY